MRGAKVIKKKNYFPFIAVIFPKSFGISHKLCIFAASTVKAN
jgi:hypothetical protein